MKITRIKKILYFLIFYLVNIAFCVDFNDVAETLVSFTDYLSNEPSEYQISPNCPTPEGITYKKYGYLVVRTFIANNSYVAYRKQSEKYKQQEYNLHSLNNMLTKQQLVGFELDSDYFQVTWPGACVTGILLPSQESLQQNRIPTEKPYFFLPLKDMYLNIKSTDYNSVTQFDYGLNCIAQKYISVLNDEKLHYLTGNTTYLRDCFNKNYNAPGIWSQCNAKFISGLKNNITQGPDIDLPIYKNIFHCDKELLINETINKSCDIALRKVWGLIESFSWICDRLNDVNMIRMRVEWQKKFENFAKITKVI